MGGGTNVLIVEARFYEDIADELVRGASQVLDARGVKHDRVDVPGTFEIPAAIMWNLSVYDGFIALGCVIRGETTHYDYVCGESARGLQDLALQHRAPIGYGILTVENKEQAWERASVDKRNKGKDAAEACLRMIELKYQAEAK